MSALKRQKTTEVVFATSEMAAGELMTKLIAAEPRQPRGVAERPDVFLSCKHRMSGIRTVSLRKITSYHRSYLVPCGMRSAHVSPRRKTRRS